MGVSVIENQKSKKFLVDEPEFPYCMGCGHTWINKSLDLALQKLAKEPTQINLVSDIGCVGLVDKLFLTNTIHTTHGRSPAFATGLQLADELLYEEDTKHIIMIGDGGATIGLLHLVEAAKLNTNITVILHNNFVYGMTGGQNSGLTPENFKTSTTMAGNIVAPVHIAHLLEAAHAGFIARKLATDKDLDEALLEAINYPGFAIVEIVELCTGYATKWNKMTKNDVEEILSNMDSGELGILKNDKNKKTYGQSYRDLCPKPFDELSPEDRAKANKKIEVNKEIQLKDSFSVVIAGSAGEGVQFASRTFLEAGVTNGLNVIQKNDNPVTIGTGFSLTELNFASEEIYYSGIEVPDYILISSIDGLKRSKEFIERSSKSTKIIIDSEFEDGFDNKSQSEVFVYPFRKTIKNPRLVNFMMIGYLLKDLEIELDSIKEVVNSSGKSAEPIIKALDLGFAL